MIFNHLSSGLVRIFLKIFFINLEVKNGSKGFNFDDNIFLNNNLLDDAD